LQPHQINDLHKSPSEWKRGLIGSIMFHILLVIILLIAGFITPLPLPAEQGILVNFGTDETGSGLIEPSGSSTEITALPEEPTPVVPEKATDQIMTQDIEKEAPVVKSREKIETDRKIKEQEEIERKRVAEEQQRLNDIMARTKNALVGAQNSGTSSTSEGITGGAGNQGVTTGSVNSTVRGDGSGTGTSGISYSLGGRGSLTLPKPKYDNQVDGTVVIEVTVDRTGNVTNAVFFQKGSTTLDEYLIRVSRDAAMLAKFEPKPNATELFEKGTISYTFILK
jgi:colicin import membrane protein